MKKRVNITIEDWLLDCIDRAAKKRGIDRSTLLSILAYDNVYLDEFVKEHEDDDINK